MLGLFDPQAMPVFFVYGLVALLLILVALARSGRLHARHGMALIMLFVSFSRIFFFDYRYEAFGEGSFYIGNMMRGIIPGLGPIYDLGINPPAVFSLFYFTTHVVGLDPVVSLKVVRLILGASDTLLVYLIATRLLPNTELALAATALFSFCEPQLSFFEGDQFKNLLGHTFFLALVLVIVDWLDALGRPTPFHGRRLLTAIALSLGMVLSHQVYMHVLAGMLGLTAAVILAVETVRRVLGRRPGALLVVGLLSLAAGGYAMWFHEFLPYMGVEGLVALTESDYGQLGILDEVRRPGILFYNIWILIATIGALLCGQRDGERRSVAFLLTLFGFFTVLAKQYVIGLLFQPVRFLMIDGPFLALFAVYCLWRWSEGVAGLRRVILWGGVGLLILGNLAVMEMGSAHLDLTQRALRVPLGELEAYLFGGPLSGGQFWLPLALSAALVLTVLRTMPRPGRETPAGRPQFGVFLFLATAVAGIILGSVWFVQPVVMTGAAPQFIALLFPAWALGWMPWRAVELPVGEETNLMRLVMGAVASLFVFVAIWYGILFPAGGDPEAIRWSTVLTFLAPAASLLGLGVVLRPRRAWSA